MANMHDMNNDAAAVHSFNSIGDCLIATLQPDVDEAYLRQLETDQLARLIYYCGYYNAKALKLKAFARWLDNSPSERY